MACDLPFPPYGEHPTSEENPMGKPSTGTPKDMRLKANRKPKPTPAGTGTGNATKKGTFKLFTKKR